MWCYITDVTNKITDGTHNSPINTPKGDFKYITAKNIKAHGIELNNISYVSKNIHNEIYARCNPEKGDILYIKDGATTGVVTLNNLDEQFSLLSSVALIKPNKYISNKYLLYYLQSPLCYDSVRGSMKGVGITRITLKQIEKWELPLPPLSEQERIVCQIENWLSLIDTIEKGKENISIALKQAKSKILDLAIHGKLVPQDPNDEPASELLKRINPKAEITCDNPQYGKLPKGWCLCKISSVVDIVNGKSQKNVESPTGKYPIYGSGGIIGKAMEYTCLAGSTIIGRKGTINHPIFVEENFWNVDTAFGMKANNQILEDEYFYCFCLYFDFSKLDKSSALPSLTKTAIGNLILPIPPLAEQQRIVAKIEEFFSQLDKIESSLQA